MDDLIGGWCDHAADGLQNLDSVIGGADEAELAILPGNALPEDFSAPVDHQAAVEFTVEERLAVKDYPLPCTESAVYNLLQ